jgi:hypothetical protein
MARYEREHITMDFEPVLDRTRTAARHQGRAKFVCDARKRPADEALRLAVVEMTGGGLGE